MNNTLDIGALRGIVEAVDHHEAMKEQVQAQQTALADIEQRIVKASAHEQALITHIDELTTDLARLRGELIAEDEKALALPVFAQPELNWSIRDTIESMAEWLEGWCRLPDTTFHHPAMRRMVQWYAQMFRHLHNRLTGTSPGGV